MFHVRLPSELQRNEFIARMADDGVHCVFHYVPLHTSDFGQRVGTFRNALTVTDEVSATLVRLPLWVGLDTELHRVLEGVSNSLRQVL
jgi:dTDP-4-amino-4,6-dideoxygalactose transaminase